MKKILPFSLLNIGICGLFVSACTTIAPINKCKILYAHQYSMLPGSKAMAKSGDVCFTSAGQPDANSASMNALGQCQQQNRQDCRIVAEGMTYNEDGITNLALNTNLSNIGQAVLGATNVAGQLSAQYPIANLNGYATPALPKDLKTTLNAIDSVNQGVEAAKNTQGDGLNKALTGIGVAGQTMTNHTIGYPYPGSSYYHAGTGPYPSYGTRSNSLSNEPYSSSHSDSGISIMNAMTNGINAAALAPNNDLARSAAGINAATQSLAANNYNNAGVSVKSPNTNYSGVSNCPTNLRYLDAKIPAYSGPSVHDSRNAILNINVKEEVAKHKALGWSKQQYIQHEQEIIDEYARGIKHSAEVAEENSTFLTAETVIQKVRNNAYPLNYCDKSLAMVDSAECNAISFFIGEVGETELMKQANICW